MIIDTMDVSDTLYLIRVVLKKQGYNRKNVLVQARPSSTEIATSAFLERRNRDEAWGRRVVSFFFDETLFG